MENVKEKLKAINRLVEMDHAILTVEFAKGIAGTFGVKAPVEKFVEGTGRVERFTGEVGHGVSAHVLAEVIAESMNLKYPAMFGIGSRLRVACAAVKEYLTGGR